MQSHSLGQFRSGSSSLVLPNRGGIERREPPDRTRRPGSGQLSAEEIQAFSHSAEPLMALAWCMELEVQVSLSLSTAMLDEV